MRKIMKIQNFILILVTNIFIVILFQNCSKFKSLGQINTSSNSIFNAKLLFKTKFGTGVTLGSPYGFYPNGFGAWQDISGVDQETGYAWPVTVLGSNFSGVQLITYDKVTPLTIGEHSTNEIKKEIGPKGDLVNILFQSVNIKGVGSTPLDKGHAQAPLLIRRDHNLGDLKNLYISYWFKHQANLVSQLDASVSSGNWRVQFEFKTGGYENTGNGDYRIQTTILKTHDGQLYWMSKGDNGANGPFPFTDYWRVDNHDIPVPINEWFFFEVYWQRSNANDGRYWAAVNGKVVTDHWGPNMGDYNLPINRVFIVNTYSGGSPPVESRVTDIEIWSHFPCGNGQSCYKGMESKLSSNSVRQIRPLDLSH